MQTSNNASFTERNAALIKGFIIGFLIIVLLIPTFMINGIISERQGRKDAAIIEVSSKWGNRQTFVGPVLKVPYYEILKTENINAAGKKEIIQEKNLRFAYFLPEKLKINGVASPESRFRGIYEIVVYSSKIACSGNFSKVSLEQFGATKENIDWKNAIIMLNISDLRGIEEEVVLDWNGKKTSFNPGAKLNEEFTSGIQTPVIIEDEGIGEYNFSLNLSLKGSASLNFVPVGKTTEVAIKSNWKNPSFDGAFLPDKRIVNEKGFVAEWKVLHLNRNFPQQWNTDISLNSATFGVDLITPNDSYQKSDRSVKYAILIIALTFMAFFFIEILNQKTVHPFHYILIGLALCIFYTLLISISEFISFNGAYLVATAMTMLLVFLYSRSIFQNFKLASIVSGVMLILYGFIFTIIQLEDSALLIGSIGLFLILAIVMYISRRIDWYSIGLKKAE